jgi:CheY-like chemotaxis protein
MGSMNSTPTTLLLVEDDVHLRHLLTAVIGQTGLSVRSAEDGFAALTEIDTSIPDLILSDLQMPGMSGFELLSVVRRRFPAVRVIAMSSAFTGEEIPTGIAADAFYGKASNPKRLLNLLTSVSSTLPIGLARDASGTPPTWIARHDDPYIVISCTNCLRTFPRPVETEASVIQDAHCIYCRTLIRYAVVEPFVPADATLSTPRAEIYIEPVA